MSDSPRLLQGLRAHFADTNACAPRAFGSAGDRSGMLVFAPVFTNRGYSLEKSGGGQCGEMLGKGAN